MLLAAAACVPDAAGAPAAQPATGQKHAPVAQPLQCCGGTAASFVLELKPSGCYTKLTNMPPLRCPVQPSRRIACPTCRAPAKVADLVYIDARLASPNKVWAAVLVMSHGEHWLRHLPACESQVPVRLVLFAAHARNSASG